MPYTSVSSYHRLTTISAVTSTTLNPKPSPDYLTLFRSAVSSFSRRPDHFLSRFPHSSSRTIAAVTRRFLRHLSRPSTASYNALINSLLLANQTAAASAAFSSLLSSGFPLTTSSFTIFLKLILSSTRADRFDSAYSLLDNMLRYGPPPDTVTYSTIITALSRAGRIMEAIGLLDFMLDNQCCPTPQACNSIIHGYCSQGRIKEAMNFVVLTESFGFVPDTFMYTVLIDALSRKGDFDEVEKILGESQLKGWKPDEVTYNVYMNGLCKARRFEEAFGLLDVMRFNGLLPNLDTLNILFDCLCRDSWLLEAMDLLGKSSELDWFPDVVFYNTFLSRCLDSSLRTNSLQIFSTMVKRGIEPDTCTLTLLIRCLFINRKLRLARCMITGGWSFVPDVFTFNTLFHQLYLFGESREVLEMFTEMIQKNVTPNKFTFCIVIDSLYKEERIEEAIELVIGTIGEDFMQDLVSRLLRWLAGDCKLGEILNLFKKLAQNSAIAVASVNSLIFSCCRAGLCQSPDFYRLSTIIDKILGIM
ncbi:hypothetical protein KSP40_PGU000922 [Platanthera guangdongensis]|uniref:Pentatricopeptide repeat-containing protein n=1 Tax=Platanthera guangdongensis TaxID=2320717 RepID=A0ABR2MMN0_9ASPA